MATHHKQPTTSTSAPPPLPHVTQTLTPVQNRGTATASAWLSTWLAIDVASSLRTSNGRDVKCHCFGLAWFTCTIPLPPHPKRRHSAPDAKAFGAARHALAVIAGDAAEKQVHTLGMHCALTPPPTHPTSVTWRWPTGAAERRLSMIFGAGQRLVDGACEYMVYVNIRVLCVTVD